MAVCGLSSGSDAVGMWGWLTLRGPPGRWTLQAAAGAGIAMGVCCFSPYVGTWFGSASSLAGVSAVLSAESTAGASMRRGGQVFLAGLIGSGTGAVLFVLAMSAAGAGGMHSAWSAVLMVFLSMLLVMCISIPRRWGPKWYLLSTVSASGGQTVLFACYAGRVPVDQRWSYALKRAAAYAAGSVSTVMVVHLFMRHEARRKVSPGIASLLVTLADLLDALVDEFVGCKGAVLIHASCPQNLPEVLQVVSTTSIGRDRSTTTVGTVKQGKELAERLTTKVRNAAQQLAAQRTLATVACEELRWCAPKFPKKVCFELLGETRSLVFQISSLVHAMALYAQWADARASVISAGVGSRSALIQRLMSDPGFRFCTPPPKLTIQPRCHSTQPDRLPQLPFPENPKFFLELCTQPFESSGVEGNQDEDISVPTAATTTALKRSSAVKTASAAGEIAAALADVLREVANELKSKDGLSQRPRKGMREAHERLDDLEASRRRQRAAFGVVAQDLIQTAVPATAAVADWEAAIGVSMNSYPQMSEDEKEDFWDAYWLSRDMSSSILWTLQTMYDTVDRLSKLSELYIISCERTNTIK